jgi:FkbM family methyltransferase
MSAIYKGIYRAGQALRKRNYKLFRAIVENPLVRGVVQLVYGKKLEKVKSPEGYSLTINPVYHGNFLSTESISAYEPEMRQLFSKWIGEGSVVYDIGANVGVFSLLFVKLAGDSGQVYAFEPESNNTRCLLSTKEDNALSNLEVHAKGVGQKTETLFFDRRGGAMSGHLVEEGVADDENVTEMQVVSVDDLVFNQGKRAPTFLKVDVEGNEVKVFEGAERTLAEHKPVIICELHHSLEPAVLDIHGMLSAHGYKCFDVQDATKEDSGQPLDSFQGVHHILAYAQ